MLALSIIFGFLFWRFGPNLGETGDNETQQGPTSLLVWGMWEEENLMRPAIEQYQRQNPNITVIYERKSSINYRTRAQTQISEGQGPDIFLIHNSWLSMMREFVFAAPTEVFSLSDYRLAFYPVAEDSFVKDDQVYGAPTEIDGLALYINEELLSQVGGTPPKNWEEFISLAVRMTVRDEGGVIKTAGAALGTASNVDHFSDILGLLLLQQPGVNLENPATPSVAEILRFYTSFVTDPGKKSWDVDLPSSTQMFVEGRLGFYFAPSWRAHELRVANPNLKFKIAPVPQLPGREIAWASFWGWAISNKSQNPNEAWKFVKFLTSQEGEKLMYQEASKIRLFGQPYSRVDLAQEIISDPLVGAYVTQGPKFKFWYLASNTFDNGINDEMIKYFEDGINATLAGTDPQVALQTVARGVTQVLEKFTKPPAQLQAQ